ncbi:MAG: GTPase HflX [Lachnospiraceae bacterium]|nr:GTPase HflX [Lachnospiraceae bacterium]
MENKKELYETKTEKERVILVGIENEDSTMGVDACLDELEELINTAGAEVVGRLVQKRERPHPGHYLGKGKLEELEVMVNAYDATGIVCDDDLSPAQMRNLEQIIKTKIMDRTMVVLDIFAQRASSREGKIQVELAQLKYRLSRLTGMGTVLSRLGGGIGTRGPGEKKLEMDRRHIKESISQLNHELKEIRTHRQLLRTGREKSGTPVVALVGYTNAGKSTILNRLTQAGVLEEDKLFATLDTTTRKVELPGGSEIMLTDTVGFIQKLSHHLVEAFKATLEELKFADILLHVVDSSNPSREEHMEVVYKTLKDLGCEGKPVITVFNKIDKDVELPLPFDKNSSLSLAISAYNENDLVKLIKGIEDILKTFRNPLKVVIPYSDGAIIGMIHGKCDVLSEEHTENGYEIELYADEEMENRLDKYIVE